MNFIRNLPDMKRREIATLLFVLKRPDPSFSLMPKTRILYFCIYSCNSLKQPSTTFSFRSYESSNSAFQLCPGSECKQFSVARASCWTSVYSSSQLGGVLMYSEIYIFFYPSDGEQGEPNHLTGLNSKISVMTFFMCS